MLLLGIRMKTLDLIVAVLLVMGGLNWGLVGIFNFNFIDFIFDQGSALARSIYIVMGLCGLYQIIFWKTIQKRWK